MNPFKRKLDSRIEDKVTDHFNNAQIKSSLHQEINFEGDKIYQRIKETIHEKEKARKLPSWLYLAAATVTFILFSAAALYYYNSSSNFERQIVLQEKKAAPGLLTKVNLPDGTEIWLNAGSKIKFPNHFPLDKREVILEGEAFFNVKHEEKRPFLIHTQAVVTQVLGTSFNISSYPGDKQTKVTVISGKVAVYEAAEPGQPNPNKPLFLTANQQGVYTKKQKNLLLNKQKVKSNDAIAWKEGNLIFKDTELSEVIGNIERRYAIRIEMESSLSCPVTVNFNNEPLDNVMRVLAKLVNGKVTSRNGTYQLSGKICQ
jgi:transmembrane sensor